MTGIAVPASALVDLIETVFESLGLSPEDAACLADSLVSADLEGVSSHGVALVPMYVERVRAGSVSVNARPTIVEDHGGLVVLSAANTFGQVSSQKAVGLATERARAHGVALVAVRDAFHFGAAAYWSRKFAEKGMVGLSFSNTRPLMPAPGGATSCRQQPDGDRFPSASGIRWWWTWP